MTKINLFEDGTRYIQDCPPSIEGRSVPMMELIKAFKKRGSNGT